MTRRIPTPDDDHVWREITRDVKPLRPLRAPAIPVRPVKAPPAAPVKTPRQEKAIKIASAPPKGREIDTRTKARLTRGQMQIDATLDLHGHRLHDARDALRGFLMAEYGRGARCLLVIHGKGLITGEAKIKRALPEWLAELPDIVLSQAPAKAQHGGGGASYILLRRKRVTKLP